MSTKTNCANLLGTILIVTCLVGCEEGPQTASDFKILALRELSNKDLSLAMQHCDQAIVLEPNDYDCYYVRALVHNAMGNSTASTADWKKAIELAPGEDARANVIAGRDKALGVETPASESEDAKPEDAKPEDAKTE